MLPPLSVKDVREDRSLVWRTAEPKAVHISCGRGSYPSRAPCPPATGYCDHGSHFAGRLVRPLARCRTRLPLLVPAVPAIEPERVRYGNAALRSTSPYHRILVGVPFKWPCPRSAAGRTNHLTGIYREVIGHHKNSSIKEIDRRNTMHRGKPVSKGLNPCDYYNRGV